jgi:hypothetical protein
MERDKLEGLLIDYIDGKLNSVDKHYIEQELMRSRESYKLYEELKEVIQLISKSEPIDPPDSIRVNFEAALATEIAGVGRGRRITMRPWYYMSAAAVVLIAVGVGLGLVISERREKARVTELRREHTNRLVAMISDEHSAGTRILGVNEVYYGKDINAEIYKVLIRTMNEDANSNVRLAAIEALRKFSDDPDVKRALIHALGKQHDPVVQITLIQIMVELRAKDAIEPLQKIIDNETMLDAVKDEAHRGILQLS